MPAPIEASLSKLPERTVTSHKGTFGRVLIVAGSRGMSGAACLAGLAALRGGAGLVQLAVPEGILSIVAGVEPAYMTAPLPEDAQGCIAREAAREIVALAASATAAAIGPGWGQSADLQELAHLLYTTLAIPLVIDADALNALARTPGGFPQHPDGALRVITPHPGEFSRLTSIDTAAIQSDREALAADFAGRHGVVVVLKGHESVVSDGSRTAINTTGNCGMATGGTGDVLTGLIAALLAQRMPAFEAAHVGAHLHGLAGDLAAAELSQPGLIASDLPRFLGRAWLHVLGT